ncbi:hypothetical protein [Burkholderia pseudomallei]|uniref:hypothetical protein n=1 Tax=Burkholderia pseudomallei TaxID=28450 RepID=UPI001249516B|nr:hypothetical protein [Burkholderia pseudomallei]
MNSADRNRIFSEYLFSTEHTPMSSSSLSAQQIAIGYERFLSQFPAAKARVDKLSQEVANIIDADLDELLRIEAATALREVAKRLGIAPFEYLLQFAVDCEVERRQILQARQEAMERAIGLR